MAGKIRKDKWIDDGRVVANMNLDGMPGSPFRPVKQRQFDEFGKTQEKPEAISLTKTERRAISRGVTRAYLAVLLGSVVLFTLVALFICFVWLK